MSTDDYDWETNSYESWKLGIQEIRLDKIRRGVCEPRANWPDEVAAWEQGKRARLAIWTAIGAALCAVAGIMAVVSGSVPEVKTGALVTVSR